MIYDCFVFFNENDLLEIRFEELWPVVDRFVIVWADKTFRGNPKGDLFDYDRLLKYGRKIFFHQVEMPPLPDTWDCEAYQRNAVADALRILDPRPSDTIILSDADEIPRRSVIENLDGTDIAHSLWLKKFMYGINSLTVEQHGSIKVFPYEFLDGKTPHSIRKTDIKPYVLDAGWEFSSFGTAEEISLKLKSFSHHEYDVHGISDVESIRARMRNLDDVVGRPQPNVRVEIDDTWPEAIKADRERWRKHEL